MTEPCDDLEEIPGEEFQPMFPVSWAVAGVFLHSQEARESEEDFYKYSPESPPTTWDMSDILDAVHALKESLAAVFGTGGSLDELDHAYDDSYKALSRNPALWKPLHIPPKGVRMGWKGNPPYDPIRRRGTLRQAARKGHRR